MRLFWERNNEWKNENDSHKDSYHKGRSRELGKETGDRPKEIRHGALAQNNGLVRKKKGKKRSVVCVAPEEEDGGREEVEKRKPRKTRT